MTQEELQAIIDRDKPNFRILSDQEIDEHKQIEDARERIRVLVSKERPGWSLKNDSHISIEDVKANNFFVTIENRQGRTLVIVISNDRIIGEQG